MGVVPSTEISHRDEFPLLCDWRKFETAVEIGVDRGTFSKLFFRCKRLRHFIGVDNYQQHPEFPYWRDTEQSIAANRYAKCSFASLMRANGCAIADAIAAGSLGHIKEKCVDFVYIDASHEYADACQDIAAWWPLISSRGILAGHDYDHTHPGVMQAVNEFADANNLTVYLTQEHCNSWYCYKAGMPGPDWVRV
jgi:hypothetical protein